MSKIANDFLNTQSSFCNQHYTLEEKALKIARSKINFLGPNARHYSETFFQGTPLNELKPVCPHLYYSANSRDVKEYSTTELPVAGLYYLFINKQSEVVGNITFGVTRNQDDLGFSRMGTSGVGTHSIARIITDAATKSELEGYKFAVIDFRDLGNFGLRAAWFHSEDQNIQNIFAPMRSYKNLEENHFYTESEFLDILSVIHNPILVEQGVNHDGGL